MGAGRETQTIIFSENLPRTPGDGPITSSRKLPKSCLGGAIFGCKNATMQECLTKQLFGLPSSHFSFVANISPGLPLFLFNYSDRKMHGIYEAASDGQMNIDPYAWTDDGTEKTAFPAQVHIYVRTPCLPLSENQFKKAIEDNYHYYNHFWFELDHKQAKALASLFKPLPVPASIKQVTLPVTKVKPVSEPAFKWKAKNNQQCNYYLPPDLEEPGESAEGKAMNLLHSVGCTKIDGEHGSSSSSSPKVEHIKKQDLNLGLLGANDQSSSHSGSFASLDGENRRLSHHDSESEDQEVDMLKLLDKLRCLNDDHPQSPSTPTLTRNDGSVTCTHQDMQKEAVLIEGSTVDKVEEKLTMSQLHQPDKLVEIMEQLTQKTKRLEIKQASSDKEIEQLRHVVSTSERTIIELRNKLQELETKHSSCTNRFFEHEKFIYLIGGFDGSSWLAAVDTFSPTRDYLGSLVQMSCPRSYASAAALEENIFVFGGGDGNLWYDTVECYNQRKKEWTECPRLNREKGSLGAATVREKIYAIGGGDGNESISDVEMFDPTLGRWIPTPALSRKRFAPAALELDGVIYAVGGYDGINYLTSAERYDPREAYWSKLPSMITRRGCHSLAVLNQKIYALGGYDGETMVASTEIFDPRLSCWMPGEPMGTIRGYGAAAVLDDVLYVVGGIRNGNDICDTVESFKEGVGWSDCNCSSIKKRCFLSAIVM